MIQETIVTSINSANQVHIAPMGIHVIDTGFIILPFKPSTTLANIITQGSAVINYSDDVRVFAGCITGRKSWDTIAAEKIHGQVLQHTLAHCEVELIKLEDDAVRPKLFCKTVHQVNHKGFTGFNRAQYAVLEAAILCSRLHFLSLEKINREVEYLTIGLEKTAGSRELEAWSWLIEYIDTYKQTLGAT